jgi:putative oxidoreductase
VPEAGLRRKISTKSISWSSRPEHECSKEDILIYTIPEVEAPQASTDSKAANVTLWIVQGLLAAMFLLTGVLKLSQSADKLPAIMPWTADVPLVFVRFVGIAEVAGGIGVVLPALLRIKPRLTAWAATGIATIMVLSIPVHILARESSSLWLNVMLLLMAGYVAWGRFKKAPTKPE